MAESETKDWPTTTKLNYIASQLAPSIYYARCLAYGEGPAWSEASVTLHRRYIEIAERLLRELAPPTRNEVYGNIYDNLRAVAQAENEKRGNMSPKNSGDGLIHITKSQTADTRSCDFANVSKDTLLASSKQHIEDVGLALWFFTDLIKRAMAAHDTDKLTDIDTFHRDFVTGFTVTEWWDRHRKLNRHHLTKDDGIPSDVNLIDVLDFIADCVMAGKARTGEVYPLQLPPALLERAFQNTVTLLTASVVVDE